MYTPTYGQYGDQTFSEHKENEKSRVIILSIKCFMSYLSHFFYFGASFSYEGATLAGWHYKP